MFVNVKWEMPSFLFAHAYTLIVSISRLSSRSLSCKLSPSFFLFSSLAICSDDELVLRSRLKIVFFVLIQIISSHSLFLRILSSEKINGGWFGSADATFLEIVLISLYTMFLILKALLLALLFFLSLQFNSVYHFITPKYSLQY